MAGKQKKPTADSGRSKSSGVSHPTSPQSSRVISSRISSTSSNAKPGMAAYKAPQVPTSSSMSQTDEMTARLASVRSDYERVAGAVALASLVDALENVTSNIDNVSRGLADVRARGYRFGRDWETQLETLRIRWPQQRIETTRLLEGQRRVLNSAARDIETLLQRAGRDGNLIGTAQSRVTDLQFNISGAERQISSTFDGIQEQVSTLQQEVDRAGLLLNALDSACFDLLPDEHGVAVCEAAWTSDQQQPEGMLFLTDSRLIFEQRQEVAKKKVLFITTEKELIQEKLWEAPIGAVDDLEAEDKKSFLRRQELLTLRFSERTRELPGDITLQLKGADNETWRSLIRSAKSGQIDGERFGAPAPEEKLAAAVEQEATEPEKELPTVCPNCAAPLPAIFKGMKQVTCDYCGTTTNI